MTTWRLLMWVFLILGSGVDYASTRYALARGAKEANPILRALPILKIVGTLSIGVVLSLWVAPRTAGIEALVIAIGYAIVALHNIRTVS